VAALTLAAAAMITMPSHAATSQGPASLRPPAWIISAKAVTMLGQSGLSGRELQVLFGNHHTFMTGTGGLAGAVRTVTFTSYAHLRATLSQGTLPAGTQAVLYDNEAWSLTPRPEQQDPARYERLAAQVVHAHHLLFVSTPATDLTDVLAPGATDHYATYLRLGLAAQAARYADVLDIQAQGSEADLAKYVPFLRAAAAQARQANPRVIVLAGVSTNPSGQHITSAQFTAAVQAVRPYVDGFWLNIPAAGTACPRCGVAQPQVAVPLLRTLIRGTI
jgi:hypothetical protein